ncbi:MAG: hypothetical protein LUD81_11625 [Clostridiales bacterium]|nr:hypothetical protein [Clostridiales bacterium]
MKNFILSIIFLALGIFSAVIIYEALMVKSGDYAYCKNYIESELKSQFENGYEDYKTYVMIKYLNGEQARLEDVMSQRAESEKYGATTASFRHRELAHSLSHYWNVLEYSDKYGLDPSDFSLNLELKFKKLQITPFDKAYIAVNFNEIIKYGEETVWYGHNADYEITLKKQNEEWEMSYMNWDNLARNGSSKKEYADGRFSGEIKEYTGP